MGWGGGERYTVCRPGRHVRGEGGAAVWHGRDLADLEPHVAGAVPGVDVLAVGHAGHVEGDGAEVGDGRHGDEAQLGAGGDGGGRGAGLVLEAADVDAVDVGHAVVVLVVLGPADRGPFFFLFDAVYD